MRARYSLEYLQSMYDSGEDKTQLQNLVKAFKGIQELPPENENSFWKIAAYHGELDNYCNHGNVLFPTWHRAYLLRLENALHSIEGCENVTLPFWDETITLTSQTDAGLKTVPSVLTSITFPLDGKEILNPLYSYTYQTSLAEGQGKQWTKPKGYQTVRYPLSGLVGDEQMMGTTEVYNMQFPLPDSNVDILNNNVKAWLEATVQIDNSDFKDEIKKADYYSAFSRYKICMNAPNFTVFSNIQSQAQWVKDMCDEEGSKYVASVESPHNAIHLALGGFFQYDDDLKYNADEIRGANGDMGVNEVASYDPAFFFHHCFVDLVFWSWQKKNHRTAPGSLDAISGYAGATLKGKDIDMETELVPFRKSDGSYYISHDVTNIEDQLDYVYGPSSMDQFIYGGIGINDIVSPRKIISVENISTADYSGSFVIRLYATNASGKKFEVGREPILSRWNVENCSNCVEQQNIKAIFPISEPYLNAIKGSGTVDELKYSVEIQGTSGALPTPSSGKQPTIVTVR